MGEEKHGEEGSEDGDGILGMGTHNEHDERNEDELVSDRSARIYQWFSMPFVSSLLPVSQGQVGQDTLSAMIRKDELAHARRRRFYDMFSSYHDNDNVGKLTYPAGEICCQTVGFNINPHSDYVQVCRWVRNHYGPRSAVCAVFMLHAVLNENATVSVVLKCYE